MAEYIVEIADNMWAPDLYSFDKSELESIVRCKECRYFFQSEGLCGYRKPNCYPTAFGGFCAWGARRED